MAIGGGAFQTVLIQAQVNTGQQLLGLITTAGEEGCAQTLDEDLGIQLDRSSRLSQRELRKIIGGHPPHLITAREAGQLDLLTAVFAAEGDRAVGRHPRNDLTKQPGGKGDGTAGGD